MSYNKMICQGYGGVLGKTCFNQYDCMRISDSMFHYGLQRLESRIEYLEGLLVKNNINFRAMGEPIPDEHGYLGDKYYPQSEIIDPNDTPF